MKIVMMTIRDQSGAIDVPFDGIDQDCDGIDAILLDNDGDGVFDVFDCDDSDASIYPGAQRFQTTELTKTAMDKIMTKIW